MNHIALVWEACREDYGYFCKWDRDLHANAPFLAQIFYVKQEQYRYIKLVEKVLGKKNLLHGGPH